MEPVLNSLMRNSKLWKPSKHIMGYFNSCAFGNFFSHRLHLRVLADTFNLNSFSVTWCLVSIIFYTTFVQPLYNTIQALYNLCITSLQTLYNICYNICASFVQPLFNQCTAFVQPLYNFCTTFEQPSQFCFYIGLV